MTFKIIKAFYIRYKLTAIYRDNFYYIFFLKTIRILMIFNKY